MGATGIEWTRGPNGEQGYSFNPWIGCTRISGACDHCYAAVAAIKLQVEWGGERKPVSDSSWNALRALQRKARREGKRFRVFVASMADVLDNHKSIRLEWRVRLYMAVVECPDLDFLFLTKRPQNGKKYLPHSWFDGGWPRNVWFGVTGEDQTEFDRRTAFLKDIPAPVRFVSVEPMLSRVIPPPGAWRYIDWIIAGGESGALKEIRDTPLEHFEALREECQMQGIAYFQKQLAQLSARATYKKFELFPASLQVRQQPEPRVLA